MEAQDEGPAKPNAQMRVMVIVSAALIALLIGWYFLVLRQDYAVLYSDLRPQDTATIVEALEKQGVPYRLAAGGAEIRVPSSRMDAARVGLASSELTLGGRDGFELFNESDMGLTDFAQKIRYQRALQGELQRTIMMMDGVADARVHISMPERTLFRGERRSAEAAVTLVMRSPEAETPARIEGVQRLVAASVPDLLVSDVVVLNARGEIISPRIELGETLALRSTNEGSVSPNIDSVMEIMRAALPSRRFEVTIESPPADLAGARDGEPTSAQRVVTVLTTEPLFDDEMERVSTALRRAGVVDGDTGGTLAFRVAPPSNLAEAAPTLVSARADPSPLSSASSANLGGGATGLLAVALLAIAAVAALFIWLWTRRATLAAVEHERFADRLKAALQRQAAEPQDV